MNLNNMEIVSGLGDAICLVYLSFMNIPDVIMSETSNGTKYAMAKSTELNAMEKKYPKTI